MSARILLIEDTEDLGEMIRDILAIKRYDVRWAKDGESGLQFYIENKPDLIITDVVMPKLNGLDVVRKIRAMEGKHQTPIIVLSARASPEDQLIALEAGATIYITKPCSTTRLINSVQSLL